MPLTREHLDELRALLGTDGVLSTRAALFTYEADALAREKAAPDVVVLPRSTDEVAAIVRWARARGVPVTARGAGTGLAGGSTPLHGGLLLSLNRMDRLVAVDPERGFAWVQAGMVNLELSRQVAVHGLYFAPDPSSQPVSTIGGNVSANSGGPHCLKYGVTFNHVLGMIAVLQDGTPVTLGGEAPDSPDFDLASLVTGSEGTLGIITEICVRLMRLPEAVQTMLFDFETVEASGRAVSAMIADGIIPAAMEIMDRSTIVLIEEWLHIGLPLDAGAVLLVEVDGPAASLDDTVARVLAHAQREGARSTRVARDAAERATLWRGRKSAFGAYGRSGRGLYVMDGVVPRTRLAEALAGVERLCAERGLESGNVFHAGDGNLHPHVMFDRNDPAAQARALDAAHEILRMCIRMGGTISGEHGIGIEKRPMMLELYAPADLALMRTLRDAFDPDRALNPCKILPGDRGCDDDDAHGHVAPAQLGGTHAGGAGVEGPWT